MLRQTKDKVTWDRSFRKDRLKYNLALEEDAKQVTLSFKVPDGASLKINGKKSDGTYKVKFDGTEAAVLWKSLTERNQELMFSYYRRSEHTGIEKSGSKYK